MTNDPLSALCTQLREATRTEDYHYEGDDGFIPKPEMNWTETYPANRHGEKAAAFIERLAIYLCHDVGCPANDLDPLDHSPCTCGLRLLHNPKGMEAA